MVNDAAKARNGEERSQALSECHGHDVVLEDSIVQEREYERDPHGIGEQLDTDPATLPRAADLERRVVQTQRKPGSEQQRAPSRQTRTHRLDVFLSETVAMVAQMVDLNRVHRSEHQDT